MECGAGRSRGRAALVVVAVVGTLAVVGCGGDEEGETTAAGSQDTQPAKSRGGGEKQDTSRQGATDRTSRSPARGDGSQSVTPPPDAGPTPGSKQAAAGVPVNPGGDNSVQTHGTEASNPERRQAAATLQAYLEDRAAGRWAQACSLLAAPTRREVGRFLGAGRDGEGSLSCPQAVRTLTEGLPVAALRASAQIDLVLSFRTEGRQGFLLFNGPPDTTLYTTTMVRENGEWRVATLAPTALPV